MLAAHLQELGASLNFQYLTADIFEVDCYAAVEPCDARAPWNLGFSIYFDVWPQHLGHRLKESHVNCRHYCWLITWPVD